jgi:hypothetical protein
MTAAMLLTVSSLALAQTSTNSTTRPSTTAPTASTSPSGTATAAGSSMMSESQVKKQLEQQGYSDVKLHQDSGTAQKSDWSGTAKKGGKEVSLHIDSSGKVTER